MLSIQKLSSKGMNFVGVIHFTINGFKRGMYYVKMALSCRNMSKLSGYNVIYIVSAVSWYIKNIDSKCTE